MSCIITDKDNKVVSVSFIPGIDGDVVPENGHCYFPVIEKLPIEGDIFIPDLKMSTVVRWRTNKEYESMKIFLGYFILLLPFIAAFIFVAFKTGFKETCKIFGLVILLVAIIFLCIIKGMNLIGL